MEFEWDDAKAAANLAKHGVAFDEILDFRWDRAILLEDTRRDYGEPRYIALGPIASRIYVVVFTRRSPAIRLISLRKANRREVASYEREEKA
ncbi:BrnT family toxin [Pyruvatibacter mobilis]|uniref:BrnT family toxin n=1 Tax=Pyruvatibacter mobilis TaxID=1712261 RepID=UPI003BAA51D9